MAASFDNLRRHVLDGAAKRGCTSDSVIGMKFAAKTEIREDNVAFAVKENVFEFDVAVYDAILESGIEIR